MQVTWTSDVLGEVHTATPDLSGEIEFYLDTLPTGEHTILVSVTDSDGLKATTSKNFRVNTLPINLLYRYNPQILLLTNQNLIPHITSTDDDSDVLVFSYVWKKDGISTSFAGNEVSVVPPLPQEETTAGDVWSLEVTPFDGFAFGETVAVEVEIQNAPPVISALFIDTIIPYNDQTITCSANAVDLDEEPDLEFFLADSRSTVFWDHPLIYRQHPLCPMILSFVQPMLRIPTEQTTAFLERWLLEIAPEQPSVEIHPSEPRAGIDDLSCEAHSFDLDGTNPSYSYEWFVDGQPTSYTSNVISGILLESGQEWSCQAIPYDGIDFGISNSADVVVSNCHFGRCDFSLELDNDIFMDFVRIEGNDLEGSHFTLQNPFYIMTTEVSQKMFEQVMSYDPILAGDTDFDDGLHFPIYDVNWHMAAHFANDTQYFRRRGGTLLFLCWYTRGCVL